MNRISICCLVFGTLFSQVVMAQSAESTTEITRAVDEVPVGPEEKPDNFSVFQGCTRTVEKVASFGKVREVLEAVEKLTEKPSRSLTWIAMGNIEHADSLAKSNRDSLKTKNCYVYGKSLRCGNWSLRLKTLTAQEAEAFSKELKSKGVPSQIVYDLD